MAKQQHPLLLFIVAIGLLLRVVSLDTLPYGFHADEARAAWGAWSILKTGYDDRGNFLPLYYDSFGDQRPTGIFYATIPSLLLFGKSITAARLPSALAGTLSIVGLYWLTLLITKNKKVALFSALSLAISPWHIVTSRSGSEVIFSGMLILFGLVFWLEGLKNKNTNKLLLSILFGIISYFFYHTARLLVPVFWFATWWFIGKREKTKLFFVSILAFVMFLFMSQTESRARFDQVSIFNSPQINDNFLNASTQEGQNQIFTTRVFHNKVYWYSKAYIENYLRYFSGDFLIGNSALPVRYTVPFTGLITYSDLLLLLIGAASIFYFRKHYLAGVLLLLSPVVAAITIDESPNLHRALYMVFFIAILEGLGADFLVTKFKANKLVLFGFAVICLIPWAFFWHNYQIHTSKSTIVYHRDGGAMELAEKVISTKSNYSKIYLSGTPNDPTPWFGFTGDFNVAKFINQAKGRKEQNWAYQNLFFSGQRCTTEIYDTPENKALMINAEGCKDPENNEGIIYSLEFTIARPDGSWVYKGWKALKNKE